MDWKMFAVGSVLALSLAGCTEIASATSAAHATISIRADQPGTKLNPAYLHVSRSGIPGVRFRL